MSVLGLGRAVARIGRRRRVRRDERVESIVVIIGVVEEAS